MTGRYALLGLWAAATFLLDQVVKWAVRRWLSPGESMVLFGGALRVTHVTNDGAAFGLFSGQKGLFVAATLAVVAMALVIASRLGPHERRALAGLGLASGGAGGNLADRLGRGAVTDFVDVGVWPVFNLADAAIVAGVGLLMWHLARRPARAARGVSPPAEP